MRRVATFLAAGILVVPAWAAPKSVTLSIPSMDCAACPITVKRALSRLDGVKSVTSDLARRQTVVTFDDASVTPQQITAATSNAGFPSAVLKP